MQGNIGIITVITHLQTDRQVCLTMRLPVELGGEI